MKTVDLCASVHHLPSIEPISEAELVALRSGAPLAPTPLAVTLRLAPESVYYDDDEAPRDPYYAFALEHLDEETIAERQREATMIIARRVKGLTRVTWSAPDSKHNLDVWVWRVVREVEDDGELGEVRDAVCEGRKERTGRWDETYHGMQGVRD